MAKTGATDLERWRQPPVYAILSTGELLQGNHQNKVWRAMAQRPGSTEPAVPMIVKWTSKHTILAAELACALAAHALKIAVPGGALVVAHKSDLPGLPNKAQTNTSDMVLCYGSELQWPDDTSARPQNADAAEEWIWRKLCETPTGPAGGAWDELVANDDRHCDNVIYDGHRWWLIDHEFSMPSVARVMKKFAESMSRQTVIDEQAKENTLAAEVLRRRPHDHKMETLPATWAPLRVRLRWIADQAQNWHSGTPEIENILSMTHLYLRSIDLRLPALAIHLQKRMARPEAKSLWNSFKNSP